MLLLWQAVRLGLPTGRFLRENLMPTVTVDVEDLETLLFATSGIKDLEAALDQRRRNPMVTGTKGKMEAVHDRLSTAWRRAKREADWPQRVVSEREIAELKAMFTDPDGCLCPFILMRDYPRHFAQDLLLVEAGPVWDGHRIEWPAPAEPQFVLGEQNASIRYAARLTHYGRQILGIQEGDLMRPDHTMRAQRGDGLRPIGDILAPMVSRVERLRPRELPNDVHQGDTGPETNDT